MITRVMIYNKLYKLYKIRPYNNILSIDTLLCNRVYTIHCTLYIVHCTRPFIPEDFNYLL